VTEAAFQTARRIALDRAASEAARCAAVRDLWQLRTREAAEVLVGLASRPDEPDPILKATGTALGDLAGDGLVSEWDTRDLAPPAEDAFFK
jgi:hypothetical protein